VDEVDQIAAASQRTGYHAAEAFMYRHHPQTSLIKEWIHQERLGEIIQLRGVFDFFLGDSQRQPDKLNIRLIPEYGGGSLWDIGVYPLSMAQYLMGGVPSQVFGKAEWGTTGVDESFSGMLSFGENRKPGPTALISCSFRAPFRTAFEISGTKGHLLVSRPFTNLDSRQEIVHITEDGKHQQIKTPTKSLYLGEVENFQSTVLDGQPPVISLEDSRDHIRTVQSLYQAAGEGRMIQL
jgi:predicted dehydrogenase